MTKQLAKRIAGLVLIVVLVSVFSRADALIKASAPGWSLIYYAAQYALLALGLDLLGVLRARWQPAAYLCAAAGVAVYYALAGWHFAITSYGNVVRLYPAPEGGLVFGACLVLGIKGLIHREKLCVAALPDALPLLAMALLACLSNFITQSLLAMGVGTGDISALRMLMQFAFVWCLFLIPFLGKDRFGGWALVALGLPMAVLMHVLTLPQVAQAVQSGPLRSFVGTYEYHAKFFVMLALGGLYCLIPKRNASAAKGK